MSFKAAGLTYVRFSSIASKAMRRGLKPAAAGKTFNNVSSFFGLFFSFFVKSRMKNIFFRIALFFA